MIRYVGYPLGYLWTLPNTLVGFCFLPFTLLSGGRVRFSRGAMELYGGFVAWYLRKLCGGVGSMTLGHVILSRDRAMLDYTRNHEHVHVGQYTRWGPFFIPMYVISSLLCKWKGLNPYFENRFERVAYGLFPCYGDPPACEEKPAAVSAVEEKTA
jgi:hypothetical protein